MAAKTYNSLYHIQRYDLDDFELSKLLTTRTEQLTKRWEPLQKMRVRLGAYKTGLSPTHPPPPVILYF